ncbi:MAG TPA: FecR domain-containing protein [Gemmatimonadales bacterium]|nr:FecR domain-containing protein [Gemmatimonadales bacterium]
MAAELDYTLLARYFDGQCPPDEARAVDAWAGQSPERRRELERLREVWHRAERLPQGRRAEVGLARVAGRVGLTTVLLPTRRPARLVAALGPRRRPAWLLAPLGVAAALLLVAVGWMAQRRPVPAPELPSETLITTAPGQRLGLKLPDGTLVTLAPGSSLRTPREFDVRHRTVELEGEAVFIVTHDSTRPFAVRTARAVATDLGTRFVVRAYRDDRNTDIVVAEGQVAVTTGGAAGAPAARQAAADSLVIGHGERVRVREGGGVELARNIPLEDYLGWTDGRLVFRGVPLRDAARQLARWYDIEVRLEPDAIGNRRIEAAADNEPAIDVLRSISASLNLRLSREGRVYTLSAN